MLQIHSYWAYLVLALLIIATVNAIAGFTSKKEFTAKDRKISLFTLIAMHIQLIIGLGWYFMSPWYQSIKTNGMGEAMGDATTRLLAVEHPLVMIIAIVLVTIGFSKHKKKPEDVAKFKTIAIFYAIALILVLSRIPWNNWLN